MKNYYKLLEIEQDVDLLIIKKAYRRLALDYHPDRNKAANAAEKFIAITEAYEVLTDRDKRTQYDFLYKQYFISKDFSIAQKQQHQQQQQRWSDYGQQKGKEYSNMSYEDFGLNILNEIKIGASYIPNILTIIVVALGGFALLTTLPKTCNDKNDGTGLFVLLMIVALSVLGYYLFKVMASNYAEERRRKSNKK